MVTRIKLVPTAGLDLHPDAGRVPEMSADEYAGFLADVRARGVKVPLELIPGTHTVIDGRRSPGRSTGRW